MVIPMATSAMAFLARFDIRKVMMSMPTCSRSLSTSEAPTNVENNRRRMAASSPQDRAFSNTYLMITLRRMMRTAPPRDTATMVSSTLDRK